MARILILYGTTDGHTKKIAAALSGMLTWEGGRVDVFDARRVAANVRPSAYDGIIVAASIHIRNYQRAVKRWARKHAADLNAKPTAFVSVCLAILEQRAAARQEAQAILHRFLRRSGWRPSVQKIVAGALPYTRYNWLKKWVMKRIAAKAGGDTDTSRDFEYTDWDDLREFARAFAREVAPVATALALGRANETSGLRWSAQV